MGRKRPCAEEAEPKSPPSQPHKGWKVSVHPRAQQRMQAPPSTPHKLQREASLHGDNPPKSQGSNFCKSLHVTSGIRNRQQNICTQLPLDTAGFNAPPPRRHIWHFGSMGLNTAIHCVPRDRLSTSQRLHIQSSPSGVSPILPTP